MYSKVPRLSHLVILVLSVDSRFVEYGFLGPLPNDAVSPPIRRVHPQLFAELQVWYRAPASDLIFHFSDLIMNKHVKYFNTYRESQLLLPSMTFSDSDLSLFCWSRDLSAAISASKLLHFSFNSLFTSNESMTKEKSGKDEQIVS